MDLSSLTNRAKGLFKQRGGSQALKEDAQELKDIARGEGSTSDKAKEAFEAIKEPGKPGEPEQPAQSEQPAQPEQPGQ